MKITFLKSATDVSQLPQNDRPHVVMVGRSNVGKSTFINHLTGQKGLAHVSATPGRTQMINLFDVDHRFYLVDLPGYGYAKASKVRRADFRALIDTYLSQVPQIKLVFLIIDARISLTPLDEEMLEVLQAAQIPAVLIVNKTDKRSRDELLRLMKSLAESHPHVQRIAHTVTSGKNLSEVWQTMFSTIGEKVPEIIRTNPLRRED